MKKTRQILSLVLALVVSLASMPIVYTGTAAAGSIDNPTLPVGESDNFSVVETNNLSFSQEYLSLVFYQTINDEYFKLTQRVDAEKYCGMANVIKTVNLTFNSYSFADDNASVSFVSDSKGAISWAGNNSDSPADAFSGSFALAGSYLLTCTDYSWISTVTFKGASADKVGEQKLSYTQVLDYTTEIDGTVNNYQIPVTTNITVLDARAFAEELAKANAVVADPDKYSAAYVSAVQATLNDIPEGLKTLTEVYSQDVIDGYVDMLTSVPENPADYTEYNKAYAEYKSFTNSDGIYTSHSHQAYLAEIEAINKGLSKTLDASQQAVVDAAIQAFKDAFENVLVASSREETKTPSGYNSTGASSDDGKVSVSVDNSVYKFMQIEDDQVFGLTQTWTISRGSSEWGDQKPTVYGIILDTAYPSSHSGTCLNAPEISSNDTSLMLQKFTSDSVAEFSSVDEDEISAARYEFTRWNEINSDGTDNGDTTVTEDGSGRFDADRNYAIAADSTYYFQVSPEFTGLSENESGELSLSFVQRMGYTFVTGTLSENKRARHIHIATTITITDARALVKEYNNALQSLENPGLHSDKYIEALQSIVASVPQDMVNGTKYYTQAEVDAYYDQFAVLSDNKADYTGFEQAYQRIEDILANPDSYSGETLAAAQAAKEQADKLDKNLIDSVENRNLIADVTASLNSVADNAEARADYSTYYLYLDIAYNRNGVEGGINPSNYTGNSYAQFIEAVEKIDSELNKELGSSDQAIVDKAVQDLVDAYTVLVSNPKTPSLTEDKSFTQDDVSNKYTNGVVEFSVSSTEYNFVQTKFDEDFEFDVDFTMNNVKSDEYKVELNDLKISCLDSTDIGMCLVNDHICLNSDVVTKNDAKDIFYIDKVNAGMLSGMLPYPAYTYGDIAYYTEWQTQAGNDLSSLSQKESTSIEITQATSGTNKVIYRGLGGSESERVTQEKNYVYVLRLGWTETNRATGETTAYHAHIPVEMNFTDARALYETYHSYKSYVDAGNDGSFTDESFNAAKDIVYSVDTDIVYGTEYVGQDAVTAEMEKLNNALNALQSKADYTEFDKVVEDLENIVNNSDAYTKETVDAAKEALEKADSYSDLPATEQDTLDSITEELKQVVENAKEKADYAEYDAAKELADKLENDGSYDADVFQQYKDAVEEIDNALNKDLSKDQQAIVDEATQALKDLRTELDASKGYEETIVDPETTADSLVQDVLENSGYTADEIIIQFKSYTGEELAGEAWVGTGSTMRVILKSTGELLEYKLFIVMGDVDGDGKITNDDYEKSVNVALEEEEYSEEHRYFFIANDINYDGVIDVLDAFYIRRMAAK